MQKASEENQIRTCIATGEKFHKSDMIRLVSKDKGPIEIDLTGKKAGRGANVSAKHENLEKLITKNGALLARAFKKPVTKDEIEYLSTEFPKAVDEKLFRPRVSKPVAVRIDKDTFKQITKS
jgi:predicted RNA-binding protein YlxR (DUF448 family)